MVNKKSDLLTVREVSKFLCIHIRTVQRLSKHRKIKVITSGNQWRDKKSDIEIYLSYGTDFSEEPSRKLNNIIERRAFPRINCSLLCSIEVSIPEEKEILSIGRIYNKRQSDVFIKNNRNENLFSYIKTNYLINLRFILYGRGKIKTNSRVLRTQDKGIAVKFKMLRPNAGEQIREHLG